MYYMGIKCRLTTYINVFIIFKAFRSWIQRRYLGGSSTHSHSFFLSLRLIQRLRNNYNICMNVIIIMGYGCMNRRYKRRLLRGVDGTDIDLGLGESHTNQWWYIWDFLNLWDGTWKTSGDGARPCHKIFYHLGFFLSNRTHQTAWHSFPYSFDFF